MNKKIVMIGASPIASYHVKALREAGLETIAVAPLNTRKISGKIFAEENNIKKHYFSWEEMIDNEQYDGIVIASKIEYTTEVLEKAIKKNVPILVEKPISFESKDIKELVKKSHEKIIVGYNRRFYKTVRVLKDFVESDGNSIIATMTIPQSQDIKEFFANTSHSIDMLCYIFGEIKIEFVKKLTSEKKVRGIVATFTNKNKDIIQFIGNWGASDNVSLTIYKDQTKMELKPFEELSCYEGMDVIEPSSESPIRKYVPKLIKKIELESVDRVFKPGFYQQSHAFADMINNNSKNKLAATLDDAQKVMEICEKMIGKYKDLVSNKFMDERM